MRYPSLIRRHAFSLLIALPLLLCAAGSHADSFVTSPPTLTIPALAVGRATFSNVVIAGVGVGNIIPPAPVLGGSPNGSVDSYDAVTQTLFIPSVTVNGGTTPYANVSVALATVMASQVSFGSVAGADTWGGGALTIPVVEVRNGPLGGRTFCNVVVPAADIDLNSLSVSMGMPQAAQDVYNWTTSRLNIPAVSVAATGRVYTNVAVTLTSYANITSATCGGSSGLSAASGTITGAWVQGVNVAMSGGATGTTTTDANGHYGFANLPPGQSYTFTPSLAGYRYGPASQTVQVPVRSANPVTVPAMTASPVFPSYSISGTVNYAGTATGPVYLLLYNTAFTCSGCSANGGTFVRLSAGTGRYTIRGLQNGNYRISAYMDALGTGQPNAAADPSGATGTVNVNSADVATGADIVLADPSPSVPPVPSIGVVAPGNGSAFVLYNPPTDNSGNEMASSYRISWGSDVNASTGGGTRDFVAQGSGADIAYVPGLADGSVLYFKLRAATKAGISAWSTIVGPVTIGEPSGGNTVSGTVTFSGTATGPMVVVLHPPHGNGGVYYTVVGSQASPPVSGASYAISGVPSGDYQLAVVIDNDNNGVPGAGDFTFGFGGTAPTLTVNGPTTDNVTLGTASATPIVLTNYFVGGGGSGYGLNLGAAGGTRQLVNATLMSGPNVAVPFDLGHDPNSSYMYVSLGNGAIAPTIGQQYGFLVTFSDGTTQIISGSVSAVLGSGNVAQNLAVLAGAGTSSPTFGWSAPAVLPTLLPFTYNVQDLGTNDIEVPATVTSVDLGTLGVSLNPGTYYWQVQVQDAAGNTATVQANTPYTAP